MDTDKDLSAIVPQLDGITFGELQVAFKVLNAVAEFAPSTNKGKNKRKKEDNDGDGNGGLESYKHSNLRPLEFVFEKIIRSFSLYYISLFPN